MFKNWFYTAICFLFCTIHQIAAQKKDYRDTQVDSLTFVNNRKSLNSLNTDKFEKKVFGTIPYRFLIPKDNKKEQKYPLVITFQNSTRIGNDNMNQLEPLARIWLREEIYDKFQCYVVAPQFNKRSSDYKENKDGILTSVPSDDVFSLLKLIDDLEKEYPNIDKNRIYLIGYSMGASTAQNLLNFKPNAFAAMISIAAVPDFSNLKKLNQKDIWLIHGEKDDENPYIGSVSLYNKLNNDKNLTFTTFTNLNHNNIVIPFLITDELPQWLFSKRK
ncbi:MAG: phospholipase [Flavobacterium sp.]|nr:MAG: phospholipase [Flavobacterium sp.]